MAPCIRALAVVAIALVSAPYAAAASSRSSSGTSSESSSSSGTTGTTPSSTATGTTTTRTTTSTTPTTSTSTVPTSTTSSSGTTGTTPTSTTTSTTRTITTVSVSTPTSGTTITSGTTTSTTSSDGTDTTFNIQLIAAAGTPPDVVAVFKEAKARWEQVITGDIPDVAAVDFDWFNGEMGDAGAFSGAVDDVVIGYRVASIDGADNTLANAGPRFFRNSAEDMYTRPISGVMTFDEIDIQSQLAAGTLLPTVLHEMGHVLGLGTNWPTPAGCGQVASCKSGTPFQYASGATGDCYADLKYKEIVSDGILMLETATGGEGSDCSHWSEAQLQSELMTPSTSLSGVPDPLTIVTLGGMRDLGYEVDYTAADSFAALQACWDDGTLCDVGTTCANCCNGDSAWSSSGTQRCGFGA